MGDRVLEVGAGTGNMSMNLMPRSIYWATDVNPAYLEYLVTLRATRPYMRVAHTNAMDAATFPTGQRSIRWFASTLSSTSRTTWRPCEYPERLEIGGRA